MTTSDGVTAATSDMLIDRALFSKIGRLVGDHRVARQKPNDAALRLFLGAAPENAVSRDSLRPVIMEWRRITDWFVKRDHDTGRLDAECDPRELKQKFEHFERILAALVRGFFSTAGALDAILEDTNS